MPLSDTISFSEPTQRLLTDRELEVINVLLYKDDEANTVDKTKEYSFAERMSKCGEVFHSKAYRRPGKSCSSIIQFHKENDLSEAKYHYGEVQEFVKIEEFNLALVKSFTPVVTTICKINIAPPTDEIIKQYVNLGLLASHHIPINGPPGHSTLEAVPCDNVSAKVLWSRLMNLTYLLISPL